MYSVTCYFRQAKSTLFYHEYVAPSYPRKGELLGLTSVPEKPFKSVLGRVEESFQILDIEKGSVFQNRILVVVNVLVVSEESLTVESLTL